MFTLGSLFDGAGTCPFAAQQCDVSPLWASEIEPFPVSVTRARFPKTKQLGDITTINGSKIDPVDIVSFGSPCQDLSIAGKREGLGGEQSGLFMEAVRIIKEMRGETDGEYPKFAIWENVPGAFSSNKGEDFRVVIEELSKIKDPDTVIPRPKKWNNAGLILADRFSIAWRVLDAQYWGVPQRRRRIFLVVDFGGHSAGEILFEREGLQRDFAQSRAAWQGFTRTTKGCFDAKVYDARGNGTGDLAPTVTGDHNNRVTDYSALVVFNTLQDPVPNDAIAPCLSTGNPKTGQASLAVVFSKGTRPHNKDEAQVWEQKDIANTLNVNDTGESRANELIVLSDMGGSFMSISENVSGTLRAQEHGHQPIVCMATQQGGAEIGCDLCPTITAAAGMSGNNQPVLAYSIDKAAFNQGENAQFDIGISDNDIAHTLVAKGPGAVAVYPHYEVRRVTPTECARLQGMPDWWCDDVPHFDSAEYKMWGNGMALPCVMYVFEGVARVLRSRWLDGLLEVRD